MATLLLELSLTRIFSVVFFYHFAFLAISIALFGLGAGGIFSYVVAGMRGSLHLKLGRLSALNGGLVVAGLAIVLGQHEELSGARLALIYFATALPFFASGTIVSMAISETVERVDRVYFFDLLGAAGGCLLLVPLLNQFGGPSTTLAAAILFLVAAAVWHHMAGAALGRVVSVGLALALVALVAFNLKYHLLDVKYAKGHRLEGESFVKWNSFSRIAIAPERGSGLRTIFIDADASTGIADFDFGSLTERDRRDLLHRGPGLPYVLRPGARTLIIGPGGGWDVARALAGGSPHVTGVEINPIIADVIMRKRFSHYSRNLYLRPDVEIHVEDGRGFVRRTREKYQVVQATLVDTWASTAAGAFALSENNLYTIEAFCDYLNHLTDDGLMAFTRWGFDPPRESLRLVALARAALERLGERDTWRHVIVGREGSAEGWGALDTVLVARRPFTAGDLARAGRTLADARMQAVYLPGAPVTNPFGELLRTADPEGFLRRYRFDVSPVTDNRPFFFYTVQPRDVWEFVKRPARESADYKINRAVPLLFGLMAVSILATTIILALPPVILGARLPREQGVLRFLVYFVAIGVGYILVEVALIQKFVFFLGHPTYALTVVIFSMLVSSGLGSFWSRRVVGGSDRKLATALGVVAALVLVLACTVSPLLGAAVGWPLGLKILAAVLMIFPAGFAMGIPFPTGIARMERLHSPSVRWAWSLNAAASVMGSALAMVCAIYAGLIQTLLAGGALYLTALVVLRASPRPPARTV